ncbi:MAG: thioesterase family protein [Chloroflexi bacterium]|nr:thioesterase family protein [Chloroflexota bacterium]
MGFDLLRPGLQGEKRLRVEAIHSARHLGSGNVEVFATPELVRLMEQASVAAVDHLLPEGHRTVGTSVEIRHLAATPVGMNVVARSEVLAVDGRRITFRVEAYDERELIGEGTHERFVIDLARFGARVKAKAADLS